MKWNFLYQITAATRTPDWGATAPQIPILSVLCPQLNLLKPPSPPNKISEYAIVIWRCVLQNITYTHLPQYDQKIENT